MTINFFRFVLVQQLERGRPTLDGKFYCKQYCKGLNSVNIRLQRRFNTPHTAEISFITAGIFSHFGANLYFWIFQDHINKERKKAHLIKVIENET